jgi:hypothetical protein
MKSLLTLFTLRESDMNVKLKLPENTEKIMSRVVDLNISKALRTINMTKAFPVACIVLQACAGLVYLKAGNIRQTIFWLGLAVVNSAITF